ncbi:hypothetical protein [Cryobacterium sp. CG_9.6]|uniref:hypothetical protein n=1 Tax=Cryobacterium sp. CG_9.6 TaxID=2760710 RepID=UPI002473BCCF|nr:hypothetical protein [Cryobacterium sp. CG_9.6]MDH6238206.1 hypothetical protein [Cryobacterium sp. CG_9.6]
MPKDKRRQRELVAQRSASTRRESSDRNPMLVEADQILADLAAAPVSYRFSFYAVEPHWLSDDLDVPVDGRLHAHELVPGKQLHLPETHRRRTINEASKGFTAPFVAVLHNPETASAPAGHAVIVQGANLTSEMLLAPLRIIHKVRRLNVMHFAALLGLPTAEGEWTPKSRDEMQEVVKHFQLRVEAEAVLAAGPYLDRG